LRVAGWLLVTIFWNGSTLGAIRVIDAPASAWSHAAQAVIAASALAVTGTAVLHAAHAWRGSPRPYLSITRRGLTHHGLAGSVHVSWESLGREYAIWPDRTVVMLDLPVYDRRKVTVRGRRPWGVRLPRQPYRHLKIPTLWRTHPWWAGQAIACYHEHSPERRPQIGTNAEHERLKRQLLRYDDEIPLPKPVPLAGRAPWRYLRQRQHERWCRNVMADSGERLAQTRRPFTQALRELEPRNRAWRDRR